ncbi:capsular polysaccharide export protein KpsC [Pseudooceanicola batsensis HTCC2597]|uniref:Capsular polysaccharide export protein KpsC n=1 Tax=Pseudooceanicola batsensis (strain ATCC BAA-863 / DSM 15984 / KCTC 12145 / HTCC2597) TaxID=252305 RepID=A3U222_PSEBH|nr:capsular polysaccharide biosynthesis protein [Pseudooceanicola batsensis]EAQ01956.1 capsular polysaccharide export protein KpsC [Pseudooceanicola batsensis HTCC2597]
MTFGSDAEDAAGPGVRRLRYFNAGFLRQQRVRRILSLAGYDLRLGPPAEGDGVVVWGHSPYAGRGEAVAQATGAPLVRVEDAFLRSIRPGREGEPPLGLVIDHAGMHFDASRPSDLETLLKTHPLDDTVLMDRARGGIARLREARISKYNDDDPEIEPPAPGYVLVIDQTQGDASVTHGGADANTFREMLYWAQEDNPAARIVIRTHPETRAGHRAGYFGPEDAGGRISLATDPVDPWRLLEGAVAVYAVSSQMGFEAILMGHRPVVFGQPFYAGWDLTDDRHPVPLPAARRGRRLTAAQLFACAMLLYPTWYHPCEDRLCSFEDALGWFEARVRARREDRSGWQAAGMRLWKRGVMQQIFGSEGRVDFSETPADPPRRRMVWAGKAEEGDVAVRVEDGFLRSRGLGAALVPPLSLALDDLGIYYDPTRESRLERWIAARADLRPDQRLRAERLIDDLIRLGLTKYTLGGDLPALPEGRRILVPGQVEDDASVLRGAGDIATNLALLRHVREANPEAVLLYKPHPDVEAGLRVGAVDRARDWADMVLPGTDAAAVIAEVDEVWTMTSLLGFEALIRGKAVTVTGTPFYSGWGLTRDLGRVPLRRQARPTLAGLVHAALIDYPRYFDPVTRQPCAVETAVRRLAEGNVSRGGPALRLLSKAQGLAAGLRWTWR